MMVHPQANRRDSFTRRSSMERTSRSALPRTSEISLNFDDLEAEIKADRANARTITTTSMEDMSGFTLGAWNHEAEATTGNLLARASLSSVWEIEHNPSDR